MDESRRIVALETLIEISTTLNEAVDLHTALRSSLERLVRLMGLSTGWIFLLNEDDPDQPARLIHTADFQLPPALAADDAALLKPGGCACQTLFEKDKLKKAINIVECSRIEDARTQNGDVAGLRRHASVPIHAHDRMIGILNIASPEHHHFDEEDLQMMTLVGNQIGLAAERARLYDLIHAQRVTEQAALLKLSNALLSSNDLQDVMDQVVQMVADVLNADSCVLVLEDANGEVGFRASVGWDWSRLPPGIRPQFIPEAPAGLAYLTAQPVRVDDFETDARFNSPTGAHRLLGFRSALAVPVMHQGKTTGALLIHAHQPRHFNDEEVRLVQLMANQAAIAIEQAWLQERVMAEQQLRRELELAREIQTSFLPKSCPQLPGWQFGAYYSSAREVGGDFYDFIPLRDPDMRPQDANADYLPGSGLLGMVIADVSDKGVPAALFMSLSRTLVRAVTITGRSPGQAIARANELILNDSQTDQFITLFYGVLDPAAATFRFVNAGHNPPLLVRCTSESIQSLRAPGIALGVIPSIKLTEAEVHFEAGDLIVMYTDGITEAINDKYEEFGVERLSMLVLEHCLLSADEIIERIIQALGEFVGNREAFDDMTMVVMKKELESGD